MHMYFYLTVLLHLQQQRRVKVLDCEPYQGSVFAQMSRLVSRSKCQLQLVHSDGFNIVKLLICIRFVSRCLFLNMEPD